MTTNNGVISSTNSTCTESSNRDHLDMAEGTNNNARLMRKVVWMSVGCPILLLLSLLLQHTSPSLTVVQRADQHDSPPSSIRGSAGGRLGENDFETDGEAGFWAQKIQGLDEEPPESKRLKQDLRSDATGYSRYLFPSIDSEAAHLIKDQTSREDTIRHRQLQVERSYPQNPQARQPREQDRPVMYTFYAAIEGNKGTGMSDEADQKLLQVWKEEWTRYGWDPRIIGLETAQQHPDFAHLDGMLAGLQMKVYDRYCFLRYLAMNVVSGGWMSDYDTFPLHPFNSSLPNEGRLTVHEYSKNGGVPDLVSGSAEEFNRMGVLLIENAYKHRSEPFWSDMFALHDLYVASGGTVYAKDGHVMPGQVITRQTRSDKVCKRTNGKYAVHFSHFAMEFGGTKGAGPEQRAEIAQSWLKQWRAMCLNNGEINSV
mmetsp:Transcript_14271/g.23632  ORF Transcript_14271/g.23632 Transcript_14271/m.23632 type:complete len:427 (-) Transcript_14271:259-1539(-)